MGDRVVFVLLVRKLPAEVVGEREEDAAGRRSLLVDLALLAEGIRELGRLREEGLITADEFEAKKDELLRRL